MKSTLYLRFIVLHLILLAIFRGLFFWFFKPVEALPSVIVQKSFLLGSRFDLRFVCILVIPLVLLAWRTWSDDGKLLHYRRWTWFYGVIALLWMAVFVFDFGFYGYLNSRMNSSVLQFLDNPDISFGMLWQSYPVVWIFVGFCAFLLFYMHLLQRFVFRASLKNFFRIPMFVRPFLFLFIFLVGLYGQLSQYPLRWSEAFFSPHHFTSHLALNPVLYFFESYEFSSKKDYDLERVKALYEPFAEYLGVEEKNSQNLTFERPVMAQPQASHPNVVVIVMESLAFSKTNLSGNLLHPTPSVEKIAKESHWFSNYFSATEGTARNMFSIMTAIPDVTKVQTSTRNPLVVDQRLIANSYEGYRKMYLVGGSASWANIRGIFSHNIQGIEMYEEDSFQQSRRADVWGVSDLDLFIEANERFKQVPSTQPFFAVIQSASFHRPYTIPDGVKDFKSLDVPMEKLKEGGFYSLEQFNSLRFADHSLGVFFELAKKSPYYKNTIFVITGDHGLPDDGGVNVAPAMHLWELEKYHVPLIIHAPALLPAVVDARPAGHPDVMTSVAALAGVSHENTTLGRNLFNTAYDSERYSFVYNYYSELNEYGLINDRFYYHYDDKRGPQLFLLKDGDPAENVQEQYKKEFERMKTIGEGYWQTARYLLFNNQKKNEQKKEAGH